MHNVKKPKTYNIYNPKNDLNQREFRQKVVLGFMPSTNFVYSLRRMAIRLFDVR